MEEAYPISEADKFWLQYKAKRYHQASLGEQEKYQRELGLEFCQLLTEINQSCGRSAEEENKLEKRALHSWRRRPKSLASLRKTTR